MRGAFISGSHLKTTPIGTAARRRGATELCISPKDECIPKGGGGGGGDGECMDVHTTAKYHRKIVTRALFPTFRATLSTFA